MSSALKMFWAILGISIIGNRWFSKILIFGIPLLDLLFLLLIFSVIYKSRIRLENRKIKDEGAKNFLDIFFFFVIAYQCFQIFRNLESYDLFLIIRDSTPFLAIGLVPFISARLPKIQNDTASIAKLTSISYLTLLILIPVSIFLRGFGFFIGNFGPITFEAPLFQVRSDMVSYLTFPIMLYVYMQIMTFHRIGIRGVFGIALSMVSIMLTGSRASILAFVGINIVGIYFVAKKGKNSKLFNLFLGSLLGVFGLLVFSGFSSKLQLVPGLRRIGLLNFFSIGAESDQIDFSALATQNARPSAWKLILTALNENSPLAGFGPGPNPVNLSGAISYLSGSDLVRSAHSYEVTFLMRSGYVFGGLTIFLTFYILLISIKNIRNLNSSAVDLMTGMGLVSLLVASSFSVILEAPFGYVPFTLLAALALSRKRYLEGSFKEFNNAGIERF